MTFKYVYNQLLVDLNNLKGEAMKDNTMLSYIIMAVIITQGYSAFDTTQAKQFKCNVQTTLEFQFSSDTTVTSSALTSAQKSSFQFLDVFGKDLILPLNRFQVDSSSAALAFPTGYNSAGASIVATYIFKFFSGVAGSSAVYVFIPVSTTGTDSNVNSLDMTSNAIGRFSQSTSSQSLSAFNLLNQNDLNVWYSAHVGQQTVLVANFIYRVTSFGTVSSSPTLATELNGKTFGSYTRLCYASTLTTRNFQTHLRQSYPLWFVWISFFIFWIFYLFADATTLNVFNKKMQNNNWTCWAFYSLCFVAHEEFFTRLSRLTVLYINVLIQGVIAGCIYGNVQTGPTMIIWVAVVAFVGTIAFPFLFGELIFKKIYQTSIEKYENIKRMIGVLNKSELQPLERAIDEAQQRIFGYYHWFYSFFFVVFFVCIPITINQMQRLSRLQYENQYYWIASVFIAFGIEHLLFEPLLILLGGNSQAVRNRGGYFYPIKMAEAYRESQVN